MILLSSIIVLAVYDDIEGPLVYQIDVLPVSPQPGDYISVLIYCIDPSGVSGAQLSWSLDGEEWETVEMFFYACLCIAGGRWVNNFGPISAEDNPRFYATAIDDSPNQNAVDTQIFSVDIQT
jgi:hypothetical protein